MKKLKVSFDIINIEDWEKSGLDIDIVISDLKHVLKFHAPELMGVSETDIRNVVIEKEE